MEALRKKGKKVAVTASTGMATTALPNMNAVTLHSWAGLLDGRHSIEELQEIIYTDVFAQARNRITTTDVLVIDEISMISALLFDKLEYVIRSIKEPNKAFGGMQMVLSGSFKQLPPICNTRYGDLGDFVFSSSAFKRNIVHHVHLTEVVRQHEVDLIMAVNQLCSGDPNEETHQLMESLSRPINCDPDNEPVRLFATNFDVDLHNYMCLSEAEGRLQTYTSSDTGRF